MISEINQKLHYISFTVRSIFLSLLSRSIFTFTITHIYVFSLSYQLSQSKLIRRRDTRNKLNVIQIPPTDLWYDWQQHACRVRVRAPYMHGSVCVRVRTAHSRSSSLLGETTKGNLNENRRILGAHCKSSHSPFVFISYSR